jgi:hypothetical protein
MHLDSIAKKCAASLACAALLSLAACSDTADQTETGGLNAADAKAVDAAAAKLDEENQLPPAPQTLP